LRRYWDVEDYPCFCVFRASNDDRNIFIACAACWNWFFGDEKGVGEVCVTYSCMGYDDCVSSL